jgi:hypothetical protein
MGSSVPVFAQGGLFGQGWAGRQLTIKPGALLR